MISSSLMPLMPHAVCWRQDPRLIWTMVVTNAITFLSYAAICATLLYLARKTRKVIARDWAFFVVGFALFIVACGTTHLMEVVTTWASYFWVAAWANIVTALLSSYVAVQIFRRASVIGFSLNDYAERLGNSEVEKARLQESLLSAQKLEEWSRLSAVMGHEIRNPLEAVQNLLYLISIQQAATPDILSMVKQCEHEIGRVVTISDSTLNFFRQSAAPEMVDLKGCGESLHFLLRTSLQRRKTEFVISAAGECTVEAYGGETRQVLLNLVRNAAEATTRDGTRISLTLRGEVDGVNLTVEDQGCGIEAAMLPKLFGFGVSTKGNDGNGMGLWAVKHIVERHKGSINVTSTPGEGTRFHIWWPRPFQRTALQHAAPERVQAEFTHAMVA